MLLSTFVTLLPLLAALTTAVPVARENIAPLARRAVADVKPTHDLVRLCLVIFRNDDL